MFNFIFIYFLMPFLTTNEPLLIQKEKNQVGQIIQIPLTYTPQDDSIKLCGNGMVESLCQLNHLYADQQISFYLIDPKKGTQNVWSIYSIITFDISDKYDCKVSFDLHKVENLLQKYNNDFIEFEQPIISTKQIEVYKPLENVVLYHKNIEFKWKKESCFDHYLLEIATDKEFYQIEKSIVIFQTEYTCNEAPPNQVLYWRVKPLNSNDYCQEFRASGHFYASDTFLKPVSLFGVSIYSLGPPNEQHIYIDNPDQKYYRLEIEDIRSQIMIKAESNVIQKMINVQELKKGYYLVYLTVQNSQNMSTLVVK
ncbi:MAG: hypothetical protein WAT79_02970 [Saprospiraceae bacterium]